MKVYKEGIIVVEKKDSFTRDDLIKGRRKVNLPKSDTGKYVIFTEDEFNAELIRLNRFMVSMTLHLDQGVKDTAGKTVLYPANVLIPRSISYKK